MKATITYSEKIYLTPSLQPDCTKRKKIMKNYFSETVLTIDSMNEASILQSPIWMENADLNSRDILLSDDSLIRVKASALLEIAGVQINSQIAQNSWDNGLPSSGSSSYQQISVQSLDSSIFSESFSDFAFSQVEESLVEIESVQPNHHNPSVSLSTDISFEANNSNFKFDVEVIDAIGGTSQEVIDLFQTLSELAMGTWAQYIKGVEEASLEVQVNVGGTNAVASAGPNEFVVTGFIDSNSSGEFDAGDTAVVTAGSLSELQTGVDPNGNLADIIINVNPEFIDDGRFFFDPELNNPVPEDAFDFYSVLLHEVAHGLGFLGLTESLPVLDNLPFDDFFGFGNVTVATLFDLLIDESGSIPVFTGSNSVALYGNGVPLEFTTGNPGSDFSHFLGNTSNDVSALVDLRLALMNPFVIPGDRGEIGALELALLEDLGHTIVNKSNVPFINTFDRLPDSDVPIITVSGLSDFDIENQNLSLGINLSSIVPSILPFQSIASSVGIEITTSAGTETSDRLVFEQGSLGENVVLSLSDVFGVPDVNAGESVSASVNVKLFNPAQGVLEGAKIGSVSETTTNVELTFSRGTNDEDEFSGGSSDDIFLGGNEEDELVGNGGNDFLVGGDGDDELFGGVGNDTMIGGNGSDEFNFSSGNDIIIDFNISTDELELDDVYQDITPDLTETEDGLLITFTEIDTLFLVGLSASSLSELDDIDLT